MPTTFASRWNLNLIDANYERWKRDPSSVDESWRIFFEGFDLASGTRTAATDTCLHMGVVDLIDAYRGLGHLLAHLDPLSPPPAMISLLDLKNFGLGDKDLDRSFDTSHFLGPVPHETGAAGQGTLRELLAALRETYCKTIGVEYMHIQDPSIRQWLQERMEPVHNRPSYARRQKLRILMELHYAEMFEKFLHTRYMGQKRFSLEGAETLIPLLNFLVEKAADGGVREIVMGMAHRGRLNVLANIIGKPYTEVFSEFEENYLPNSMAGDGDVKYHLGFSSDRQSARGNPIHLSLSPNPSHLEAVSPVVEGRTRAKQSKFGDEDRVRSIPLLLHGDAAIAGQGLVAETLNLSQLAGYKTGGTIHVVINNQIGFTTSPTDARSTRYCTDVAKMIEVPIFHVNGEDPEATMFVTELALDFRQKFHKDVFIDMYCYRRHGHNEGDEPAFTQPLMYAKIKDRPSLSEIYTEQLVMRGDLSVEETEAIVQDFQEKLQNAQVETKEQPAGGMRGFQGPWKSLTSEYSHAEVKTGVVREALDRIVEVLTHVPEGFAVHPKAIKLLAGRLQDWQADKPVDWAFAESLAFGSLLLDGFPIRLSGQDSSRGTFSQRHAVLFDVNTGQKYTPLQHLFPPSPPRGEGRGEGESKQPRFFVYDSLLSEAAVLGFEFGYALDAPETLILWEAQFGDFANGGQVIIDQFISCSYSKWQRDCGLVLLLPHGYEGQGPEHSSARLERFLHMCAEDNMQVCNATTPAQYFHLLRRQQKRNFRKPLILMTPKSLLRHKLCVSPIADFTSGHFHEILDDAGADAGRVKRLLLCSGKVYYDLTEQRTKEETPVAIVRIEQFHPFPADQVLRLMKRYPKVREVVWVQEESLNMGGWHFMETRLRALGIAAKYVGRDASASPATGSRNIHLREQKELVETALVGQVPHLVRSVPGSQRLAEFAQRTSENREPVVESALKK